MLRHILLTIYTVVFITILVVVISNAQSNQCEFVYNQSGTFICLPSFANISTALGSIVVTPYNTSLVSVNIYTIGSPKETCPIYIQLLDPNGTTIYRNSFTASMGQIYSFNISLSKPMTYIAVNASICNILIPLYAVPIPKPSPLATPPVQDPLLLLFTGILPAAPIIGFILRGDLGLGAVATLAALPAIYIFAFYISPAPYRIHTLIALTFIEAILLAAVARKQS